MIIDESTIKKASLRLISTEDRTGYLVVIKGFEIGTVFPLKKSLYVIGRSPTCDITFNDYEISRQHLIVLNDDKTYKLIDNKSKNGVYINGEQIGAKILENNDIITIGKTVLKFVQGNPLELEFHKKIFNLTRFDTLTGALNRHFFEILIEMEFEKFKRYKTPFTVAMLDLDDFKIINDRHGHLAGDFVLKETVKRIKKSIRAVDHVARLGGDEFAILFSASPLNSALSAAKRISKNIYTVPYDRNGKVFKVKVSFGLCEAEDSITDAMEILKIADEYLYKAKNNPRVSIMCKNFP